MHSRCIIVTLVTLRNIAIVVVFAATLGYLAFQRPASVHSQSHPVPAEGRQFRIIAGLKDRAAKTWQGQIGVTGAEIADIAGWRFSGQDRVEPDGRFSFSTKMGLLEDQLRPGEPYGQTPLEEGDYRRLIPEGVILKLRGKGTARVQFDAGADSFAFDADQAVMGSRAMFLDGNASVEELPMERKLSETGTADDYPSITVAPDGKLWTAWVSYRDKSDGIKVSDGSQIYSVGERGDLHAPAIVSNGHDSILAVWPANHNGAFQLLAATFRKGDWSKTSQLTSEGSNVWPHLASDGGGHVTLVWQSLRSGRSTIVARLWNGKRWLPEKQVSDGAGNCWAPTASYGGGKLWFAWDSYASGAYQIYARQESGPVMRVTQGDRFSVRPSLVVTQAGQPVIAWEESDALWGKDFAYQVDRRGTVEYKDRRIGMAYLESGVWNEAAAKVEDAMPAEIRRFMQQPQLALDAIGHLYLAFRVRTSVRVARADFWAPNGHWETFLTHLEGNRWAPAIPMPSSDGRNGMRSAVALDHGQAHIVWTTDARPWSNAAPRELDVYTATIPVTGNATALTGGKPISAGAAADNPNPREAEDLRRIRIYRYAVNGKQYRILRADFHRHTELSGDGAGDGTLDDNYRYTLDAASLDIGYVSDHQMGGDNEYNWWITQKSNDVYYMPQRFVPMYGYERSVPYPNGHRNVIWTERGKPVLRISPEELQGKINSGPVVYPYLRDTQGIATSHTSATEQGTDWRDNDPALEPVVEIYQGYDANYEEPNAPRAWKPGDTQSHQGNRPAGYVWNAWAKGYKLGVQSSSDHVSTHTSYACVLAEDFTRQGIMDALRKRHTYAATDNIVMDFRIGNTSAGTAIMGDIAESATPPKLFVRIIGSAPIKRLDVIKNNRYIHQLSPNQSDFQFEYLDSSVEKGESYYYIRVEQADGQLAWSSPIWIRYGMK